MKKIITIRILQLCAFCSYWDAPDQAAVTAINPDLGIWQYDDTVWNLCRIHHKDKRANSQCERYKGKFDKQESWLSQAIRTFIFRRRLKAQKSSNQSGSPLALKSIMGKIYYFLSNPSGWGEGDVLSSPYPDNDVSLKWCRKAAECGHSGGQYRLALYYRNMEENEYETVKWLQLSAKQGNSDAQCCLGNYYLTGRGVIQNDHEAVKWFQKAADQGDTNGKISLAHCYQKGIGVEKDVIKAFHLHCEAAEQGDRDAMITVGDCYFNGYVVKKDDVEADRWYRRALLMDNWRGWDWPITVYSAELGDSNAQYILGERYFGGYTVEQNDDEAFRCFIKSAEAGNMSAQYKVAQCHREGRGVKKNLLEAEKWSRLADETSANDAKLILEINSLSEICLLHKIDNETVND